MTFTDKLGVSDQFNHLWMKQQIDKISGDMKAIAEWEPHGIITHSYLSLYNFFLFYDTILLLECLSPLYKIFIQSQYKDTPLEVQKLFVFFFTLVFCLPKRPMIH